MIHVECREVFFREGGIPLLRLSFLVGEERKILVLKLPVFLSKFAEGVHLESGPFFERWKIIGGESLISRHRAKNSCLDLQSP